MTQKIWKQIKVFFGRRSRDPNQWIVDAATRVPSLTGIAVDEESAMRVTTVQACVRVLSETIASLPLNIYRRVDDGGRELSPDHRLMPILHDAPNPLMSSFTYRETTMSHLLLWGNAFSEIQYNPDGSIESLLPILPQLVQVHRKNNRLTYEIFSDSGQSRFLPADRIFHIPGLGFDGVVGKSPITMAREAIGLSLAAEEFGARFFGSGTNMGGVLTTDRVLSETGYERVKKLRDSLKGMRVSHEISILEEGLKFEKTIIPPDDAQFIQTRKMQVAEIARIYKVPLHLVGETEKAATFASVEQFGIQFVVHTIRPWLVRWEQAIKQQLFTPIERKQYFAEFVVDGLWRGDIATRYNAYAVGRQHGFLSADDIRRLENLNPIPDGQGRHYLIPLNMRPASELDEPIDKSKPAVRERRSRPGRIRTQKHFQPLFADMFLKILKREEADIMRKARKIENIDIFNSWLSDFYVDHRKYMLRNMRPLYLTYAASLHAESLDDINIAEEENLDELNEYMNNSIQQQISAHTGESVKELRKTIADSPAEKDILVANLQKRFDDWTDVETGRQIIESRNETVVVAARVAMYAWAAHGITHHIWTNVGEENCPFCEALDGMVVKKEDNFASKNDILRPDGTPRPYIPQRDVRHPPLHSGCDCVLMPK